MESCGSSWRIPMLDKASSRRQLGSRPAQDVSCTAPEESVGTTCVCSEELRQSCGSSGAVPVTSFRVGHPSDATSSPIPNRRASSFNMAGKRRRMSFDRQQGIVGSPHASLSNAVKRSASQHLHPFSMLFPSPRHIGLEAWVRPFCTRNSAAKPVIQCSLDDVTSLSGSAVRPLGAEGSEDHY